VVLSCRPQVPLVSHAHRDDGEMVSDPSITALGRQVVARVVEQVGLAAAHGGLVHAHHPRVVALEPRASQPHERNVVPAVQLTHMSHHSRQRILLRRRRRRLVVWNIHFNSELV
jgi:hypothetical protein